MESRSEIVNAVKIWRFKPYLQDGKAAEVETGVVFGIAPTVMRSKTP